MLVVRVTVELFPGGDPRRAKEVARGTITNDGTLNGDFGAYDIKLAPGGVGRVESYRRNFADPFELVWQALNAVYGWTPPLNPTLAQEIRDVKAACPRLLNSDIAAAFHVNQGRIAEVLNDQRFPSPQRAGGLARAASLTAQERSAVASKAANARWHPKA